MIIQCGACGNEIEVTTVPADGQHVICPFCGEKTVYVKPTRIEVPTGVRRVTPEASVAVAPPSAGGRPKPKLGIKRQNAEQGDGVDLNAQAIMRKMQMEEAEQKEAELRTVAARKKASRELLIRNAVIVLLVALVGAGGLFWYLQAQRKRQARAAVILEEYRRTEEQEKARNEANRAEAEARAAKRETERKQREAVKRQEREERQLKLKEEQKAQEAQLAEERRAVDEYRKIRSSFFKQDLRPWMSLSKDKRPGAVDGTFIVAIPRSGSEPEIYVADSKVGEPFKVARLDDKGGKTPVEVAAYEEQLHSFGGIVSTEGQFYVLAPRDRAKPVALAAMEDVKPSLLRLGSVRDLIMQKGMKTETLAFKVRVDVAGMKKPVYTEIIGFGGYLSKEALNGSFDALAKSQVKFPRTKAKRRTVVLYDGAVIKRQMNVTMVPRDPKYQYQTSEWRRLYREAERQECEEKDAEAAKNSEYEEMVRKQIQNLREKASVTIVLCDSRLANLANGNE